MGVAKSKRSHAYLPNIHEATRTSPAIKRMNMCFKAKEVGFRDGLFFQAAKVQALKV